MKIHLNGKDRDFPAELTIQGLLDALGLVAGMVVVEHNHQILEREAYSGTPVQEGDNVELVHFVGGG